LKPSIFYTDFPLQFVQSLSNPYYLHHLATQKFFEDEAFVQYCKYLRYFAEPAYLSYLSYPGPTLRVLELIQEEQFRRDLVNMGFVEVMVAEGIGGSREQGNERGT
jgi:mediator of RNA polymerase II transcription subunit 31